MRKMYSKKQIEEIAKSSGTKLYNHLLQDNSNGYYFILITTNNQPIDFSVVNNANKLNNYMKTENVVQFIGDEGPIIYDGINKQCFYGIVVSIIANNPTCVPSYYEDWDFSKTTDTVSPL